MNFRTYRIPVLVAVVLFFFSTAAGADQGKPDAIQKGIGNMGPKTGTHQPAMTDIHDIQPLVPVGMDRIWIIYGLTAAGIGLLTIALFLYWKKRNGKQTTIPAAPLIPPHEAALEALAEISDTKQMDGRRFYFRLSFILRQYIHGRYGVGAPEMTTEEFLPRIDRLDLSDTLQKELKTLCRSSDPIKFAGRPAEEGRMEKDLFFARTFVEKTRPGEDHLEDGQNASPGPTGFTRKGNRLTE